MGGSKARQWGWRRSQLPSLPARGYMHGAGKGPCSLQQDRARVRLSPSGGNPTREETVPSCTAEELMGGLRNHLSSPPHIHAHTHLHVHTHLSKASPGGGIGPAAVNTSPPHPLPPCSLHLQHPSLALHQARLLTSGELAAGEGREPEARERHGRSQWHGEQQPGPVLPKYLSPSYINPRAIFLQGR